MNNKHLLSVALMGVTFAGLAGCSGVQPEWFPRGYTYEDNTPLSSPAPTSPWSNKNVMHDTDKMSDSTAAWQGAIFDLLSKLEPFLPKDGTPLLVMGGTSFTQNDLAFDHYLRQGLMQKNQNITTTAGSAQILQFDMKPLTQDQKGAKLDGVYLLHAVVKSAGGKKTIGQTSVSAILPYESSQCAPRGANGNQDQSRHSLNQ